MALLFSQAELDYVDAGGNLWYVDREADDGWNVIRWSCTGHGVIASAQPNRTAAECLLLKLVQPSSLRTRSNLHHSIRRENDQQKMFFPLLR
jgi:hypothetical protein